MTKFINILEDVRFFSPYRMHACTIICLCNMHAGQRVNIINLSVVYKNIIHRPILLIFYRATLCSAKSFISLTCLCDLEIFSSRNKLHFNYLLITTRFHRQGFD